MNKKDKIDFIIVCAFFAGLGAVFFREYAAPDLLLFLKCVVGGVACGTIFVGVVSSIQIVVKAWKGS